MAKRIKDFDKSYNERLFSGGLRKRLHLARYYWLVEQIEKLNCSVDNVLELGCFDAKTIDFLSKKPGYYLGYDANWENAIQIAREKWVGEESVEIRECQTPDEMLVSDKAFDISICLETMEHIYTKDVEGYVKKLSEATKDYCFISVPNEKGFFFLLKRFGKWLFNSHTESYTLSELYHATTGNLSKVVRQEGGHKGFDYEQLVSLISKYFTQVEVMGIPYNRLPKSANFSIGIVAKNNPTANHQSH
jgi:2-polyprenyl-3-methyl-5-hydroxy-6-metoxy-1,4-benzoquinol methylase